MNQYVKTGIYHLDVHDADFEVAHLYEHLVIATFKARLEKHGFSRYLFGWMSGEAFSDVMFIEYGVYDQAVETLLREFIASNQRYDRALIDQELLRIQSEVSSTLGEIDRDKLMGALDELEHLDFIDHRSDIATSFISSPKKRGTSEILPLTRNKKKFRTIALSFGLREMSAADMGIFMRLRPLILDACDDFMFTTGAYAGEVTQGFNLPDNDGLAVIASYTTMRGQTVAAMEAGVRESLEQLVFALKEHPTALKKYYDGFQSTPNWHTFAIEYYRYAGVLASRKEIARASTIDSLLSLLERLELRAQEMTPEIRRYLDSNS